MSYFKVVKKMAVEWVLWYLGAVDSGGIGSVRRVARRDGILRKVGWGTFVKRILVELVLIEGEVL